MPVSVLLSPSIHTNAVGAYSPKVTCVSLGLGSPPSPPGFSMQTVPAALADHSSLSGRRAYSDREEGRPAAIKTEYMNADRGKQRGTSKTADPQRKMK